MIQRIQSLYLFAGVVLSAAILISTIFYVSDGANSMTLGAFGIKDGNLEVEFLSMFPVAILAIIAFGFQVYAISLYQNRSLQATIVKVSMLFTVLIIAYLGYVFYDFTQNNLQIKLFTGILHSPLMLFAQIMALRGINKDEALVKSVDRLR